MKLEIFIVLLVTVSAFAGRIIRVKRDDPQLQKDVIMANQENQKLDDGHVKENHDEKHAESNGDHANEPDHIKHHQHAVGQMVKNDGEHQVIENDNQDHSKVGGDEKHGETNGESSVDPHHLPGQIINPHHEHAVAHGNHTGHHHNPHDVLTHGSHRNSTGKGKQRILDNVPVLGPIMTQMAGAMTSMMSIGSLFTSMASMMGTLGGMFSSLGPLLMMG